MIGEILKERRLAKGIDLESISSDLKIRVSYLKALEEENFELFPADVYTIGYLRSYALYLGLEPEPLVEEFKVLRNKGPAGPLSSQQESKTAFQQSMIKITPEERAPPESRAVTKLFKPQILILIVIFLIVGIIITSVFKTGTIRNLNIKKEQKISLSEPPQASSAIITSSDNTKSSDIKASQSQVPQAPLPDETTVVNSQPAPLSPASDEEGYTIKIIAQELTWLKVESEEGIHDITMRPGETVKYTSRKGFKLTIGNAGGIKLSLNGKDMGLPGKSGEVKIINLP